MRRATLSGRVASFAADLAIERPGSQRATPPIVASVSRTSSPPVADGRSSGTSCRPEPLLDARLRVSVAATGQPAWTASGTSISRFRIFPVGPIGSSSTNQILRGYL